MTGLPGRGRVLVVEDEAMVAILVEDMLNALNYEVVRTAATLDQATEAARARRSISPCWTSISPARSPIPWRIFS